MLCLYILNSVLMAVPLLPIEYHLINLLIGVKGKASERIQERREKLRELGWGNQALDLEEGTTALAIESAGESPERGVKAEVAEGSGGSSGI